MECRTTIHIGQGRKKREKEEKRYFKGE